jgi:hypothetical protein
MTEELLITINPEKGNLIMKIPEDSRFTIRGGIVYLDDYILGCITPFTPSGFFELFGPAYSKVTEE